MLKKLLLILSPCLLLSMVVKAKTVTLNLPDDEVAIVENDVPDAVQWIKDAWAGKVNNCKGRMVKEEIDLSVKNGEAIPAGEDAIIQKHMSRPGYKNRKQRDLQNSPQGNGTP